MAHAPVAAYVCKEFIIRGVTRAVGITDKQVVAFVQKIDALDKGEKTNRQGERTNKQSILCLSYSRTE